MPKIRLLNLLIALIVACYLSPNNFIYAQEEGQAQKQEAAKQEIKSFSGNVFLNANPGVIEAGSNKDLIYKGRKAEFKFEKSIAVQGLVNGTSISLSENTNEDDAYSFVVPLNSTLLEEIIDCKGGRQTIIEKSLNQNVTLGFAANHDTSPIKEIIIRKNRSTCTVNIEGVFIDKNDSGAEVKSGGSFQLLASTEELETEEDEEAKEEVASTEKASELDSENKAATISEEASPRAKRSKFITVPSENPNDKVVFQLFRKEVEDFPQNGLGPTKLRIKLGNLSEVIARGDPSSPTISIVGYKVKDNEVLAKVSGPIKALLQDGQSDEIWQVTSTHKINRRKGTARARVPIPPMASAKETYKFYVLNSRREQVAGPISVTLNTNFPIQAQAAIGNFPQVTRSDNIKDEDLGFIISSVAQRLASSTAGGAVLRNPNGSLNFVQPRARVNVVKPGRERLLVLGDGGNNAVAALGNLVFSGTLAERDEFDNEEAGTIYITNDTREIFLKNSDAPADWVSLGQIGAEGGAGAQGPPGQVGAPGESVFGAGDFDVATAYPKGAIVRSPTDGSVHLAIRNVAAGLPEPLAANAGVPPQSDDWMFLIVVGGGGGGGGGPPPPPPPVCGADQDDFIVPANEAFVSANLDFNDVNCNVATEVTLTNTAAAGNQDIILTLDANFAITQVFVSGVFLVPAPPADSVANEFQIPGHELSVFGGIDASFGVATPTLHVRVDPFFPGAGTAKFVRVEAR